MKTEKTSIKIIFENDSFIVIDKPAFYDCQSANTNKPTVVQWLKKKYNFSGLVHRLDTVTSGIMVCAKNADSAKHLTELMKNNQIQRTYLAIIFGRLKSRNSTISQDIDGKEATTHYKTIQEFKNAVLIEVTLETGRKHQIRKHFSNLGNPLLGDHLYGRKGSKLLFKRAALHSWKIQIEDKIYTVEPPQDFKELLDRLKRVT